MGIATSNTKSSSSRIRMRANHHARLSARVRLSAASLLLILFASSPPWRVAIAARSLSAPRARSSHRPTDAYDRSVTTFSPEGRLLQLEYALVAAEERGRGLTVCVECDGAVVFAYPSAGDDDDPPDPG